MNASQRYRDNQRRARLAQIETARAARVQPPMELRAWAAGYFDGEGTATFTAKKADPYIRVLISVSSVDRETTDLLLATWGGFVTARRPKGNAQLTFSWRLNSFEPVLAFATDIIGLSRRARTRRKLSLLIEHIRDNAPTKGMNRRPFNEQMRLAEMRSLNRRGVEATREPIALAYRGGKQIALLGGPPG